MRLLAARDRSAQEIRLRLAARGAAAGTINATVRRLQEIGYLDERRFAHGVAERAARTGHGSEAARAQLAGAGVAESLIDDAVAAAFADETGLARRALARRHPHPPDSAAARAKAARFLTQRGFPQIVVLAIVEEGC